MMVKGRSFNMFIKVFINQMIYEHSLPSSGYGRSPVGLKCQASSVSRIEVAGKLVVAISWPLILESESKRVNLVRKASSFIAPSRN